MHTHSAIHFSTSTLIIPSFSLLPCGCHTPSMASLTPPSTDAKTLALVSSFEIQENSLPKIPVPALQNGSSNDYDVEKQGHIVNQDLENINDLAVVDYSRRAQWLRAAVLGANDGLLSIASLMMGIGAVRSDAKTIILTGIAGLVAGACSMAIGEFVSVQSQYDIEMAQMKREKAANTIDKNEFEARKRDLPSPFQAAMASAFAFALGAVVPLLAAAFIKNHDVRLGMVVAASSVALIGFGWLGAFLGRAPLVKSSLRVLFGGWAAMGITFGLTKLVGLTGV